MPTVRPEPEEMDGEQAPDGSPPDEGGADEAPTPKPSRPGVILEDIDALEQRRIRTRGRKYGLRDLFGTPGPEDSRVYRRLTVFAWPFTAMLLAALFMSGVAAMAKMGFVFTLKRLFQPIFEPRMELGHAAQILRQLDSLLSFDTWFAATDAVLGAALLLAGRASAWWTGLGPERQLYAAAGMLVGLAVLEQVNKYCQRLIMRTVSLEVVKAIRGALFDRLMTLSMRFYQANHSGKLLSRLTSDLNNMGSLLVDVLVDLSTDFLTLLAALIYLWVLGGELVILGLGIAIVSFIPVQQISRRIRRKEGVNQARMGSLYATLSETLSAQKIIKVFNAEDHERRRFALVNEDNTEGRKKTAELRARIQPVVEIIGAFGIAAFAVYGGLEVIAGRWNPTDFIAIIFLLVECVAAMRRLGDTNSKMHTGLSSADRVATVLYSEPEIVDRPGAVELSGLRQGISFSGVAYDHDPQHPVLRDITFELPKGRTLALVGPTGSGKTTLADLVPRLFDVDAGSVRIDGHDVRDVTLASLRRQIAVVTQDTVLFHDSVHGNIAYAMPGATRADVIRAATAANAHGFIQRLPQGYDTQIGERGTRLSGGERQRLAIARALLRDAPILILDEATSALDTASEALVQDAIQKLMQGRTTIVIAHRLSTVRNAHTILVLERGRIVERGSHDELLRVGGLYARMWGLQGKD
ncbi:MAG: ABC transporter ATP-binding protein [Planctomycetes bacterium]|nr:ABC transporter ATP-binding protein [Planctomycetota bacterium]